MDENRKFAVVEDVVQYHLFLVSEEPSGSEQRRQTLQQLLEQILARLASTLVPYIWQNQAFNLKYEAAKGDKPAHLSGATNFGDNVEDEWFIVYLLQQTTKEFPELAARVEDNDGEFLLIEAAEVLPKWMTPENSSNRVFFHCGELCIIPAAQDPDHGPTLSQALQLLSLHPGKFLAAPCIRDAVSRRISRYPEKIQHFLHRAYCYLPMNIAALLKKCPQLVAPAVQAFYLRDPIDLQACVTFHNFPPEPRVLSLVTFTKCLYAQLMQQRFLPDRRSGYSLPSPSHTHYKAHELGMKLAHGFEILCTRPGVHATSASTRQILQGPLWDGFLRSLQKNDYFKGELEGSVKYMDLLQQAETFFKQSVVKSESSIALSPGEEILSVLQMMQVNKQELMEEEAVLAPEDDDSWLELSPTQLEHILQEVTGSKEMPPPVTKDEQMCDLTEMTQSMKAFISKVSVHEGAEMPWTASQAPVSFDVDCFTSALNRILKVDPEELDSEDEEEDSDFLDSEEEGGAAVLAESMESLRSYMEAMDQELACTNIGKSFTRKQELNAPEKAVPEEGADSGTVDVDLNLVTNLLESYSSQAGLAGPASNLLLSMGVRLPDAEPETSSSKAID
ncbi:protein ecdysoneless homolog [Microcaecilia unicolor]|uniref:Protein ecdysoneless homolog n=1 Tax=Microcaecilia unicolor TaxID=1415580 RepID=A0A6P7Y853_9AMPH|nr:protein ecdysoneless homolog [Microcaecilia unicolor]XP_030059300.1 protein ecdysoneless homolog [Microcaecilia unicolor]